MTDNTLPKSEKLKSRKQIDLLFSKGKWRSGQDIRVITLVPEASDAEDIEIPTKPTVGFSVSKKLFKRAVDRNRGKRLLREAYRHNKELFAAQFGTNTIAMIFWTSKKLPENFQEVEEKFIKLCNSKK